MAINNKIFAFSEKITSAGLNAISEDATNSTDDIHNQYLLGTSVASGFNRVENESTSEAISFNVPFFHHANFDTNYRVLLQFVSNANNTLRFEIQNDLISSVIATPIANTGYTASALVILTADFNLSALATGNYTAVFTGTTIIGTSSSASMGGNLLALPIF